MYSQSLRLKNLVQINSTDKAAHSEKIKAIGKDNIILRSKGECGQKSFASSMFYTCNLFSYGRIVDMRMRILFYEHRAVIRDFGSFLFFKLHWSPKEKSSPSTLFHCSCVLSTPIRFYVYYTTS